VRRFTHGGIIRNIASCTHNLPYAHKCSFDYCDTLALPNEAETVKRSFFADLLGDQSDFIIRLGDAGYLYERNDLALALEESSRLMEEVTEDTSIEIQVSTRILHHSILLQMEHKAEAKKALGDLDDLVKKTAPFFTSNLEAYKTKIALLDCDMKAARAWLEHYYVVDIDHIELYLVFQHFTTARAYIVLGDYDNAYKYVTMLRAFGRNLVRVCDFGEASVLLASLEWAVGKKKEATAILEEALEWLQEYDLTRVVIDEGAAILPVLKRIAAKTGKQEHSGKLKHEFVNECMISTYAHAKKHKGIADHIKKQQRPVKLSRQQKLIITLLSRGYSNAMIIEETGLKLSTIRTHTMLAYEKLEVNSALDAVLKARTLGLIE